MVELCASILSADFARLAEEVAAAERGGATVIHVDIMDGHFVPNLTIGPPVVKSLRKATQLPLDCHLMIENADEFIPDLAEAGANWVIVHYEACRHLHRTLQLIAHHGMQPAVVINPATRVDLLVEILPMVHHVLIMSVNPGVRGAGIYSVFPRQDSPPWPRCGRNWDWHLESKWTAEWLTIPSPGSSKPVQTFWWQGTLYLAREHAERDGRALLTAARQAAGEAAERELQRRRAECVCPGRAIPGHAVPSTMITILEGKFCA